MASSHYSRRPGNPVAHGSTSGSLTRAPLTTPWNAPAARLDGPASVNANRVDVEPGVTDLVMAETLWPGWLARLVTRRVAGLERDNEMICLLTHEKIAIKICVDVSSPQPSHSAFAQGVIDARLRQKLLDSRHQRLEVALTGATISVRVDDYVRSVADLDEMIDIATLFATNCTNCARG